MRQKSPPTGRARDVMIFFNCLEIKPTYMYNIHIIYKYICICVFIYLYLFSDIYI